MWNFNWLQATGPNFGFSDFVHWLSIYRNVLSETLGQLNGRRGAEERVTLKLVVEQLCELWERETSFAVTAHAIVKGQYTGEPQTQAGRFVTAAVEAMLPEPSWFEEHCEFAHSVRAKTFAPGYSDARARQIIVIMRDFVKRRGRTAGAPA